MSTLSDHVDRLSLLAKSIRSTSTGSSHDMSGPFTDAVLRTPLEDLIRDIDTAELGLFTLVSPVKPVTDADLPGAPLGGIARAEFHGATPLKKPPAPRPGRQDVQRSGEHEPEVYAGAAVKYLDRYQSIRPMPRASEQAMRIVEQLDAVRESMRELNEKLKQHATSDPAVPPASPKTIMKDEERRIQAAQSQIAELKKRKGALMKQKAAGRTARLKPKPKVQTPSPPSADEQEETFWNTPAASARILHFTGDSLLDEHVDIADMSTVSFTSPIAPRGGPMCRPISRPPSTSRYLEVHHDPGDEQPEAEPSITHAEQGGASEDEDPNEAERTVVLAQSAPTQAIIPEESSTLTDSEPESAPPSPAVPTPVAETPEPLKRSKIKVTTELERIVSKIWATIGELIMPGRPFDLSGSSRGKPPRAKETIAHLQLLSSRTPAPSSPSISSLSSFSATVTSSSLTNPSQPTVQQILTAHMLLALLSVPPAYSMPLGRLKEELSTRTADSGIGARAVGGSGVTRPIYGCVAKRLLKIERGGGEQVVKFDV